MLALCNIGLDFQNKTSAVQLVVKPYMPHPVRLSKERPHSQFNKTLYARLRWVRLSK